MIDHYIANMKRNRNLCFSGMVFDYGHGGTGSILMWGIDLFQLHIILTTSKNYTLPFDQSLWMFDSSTANIVRQT